ncbi:hypothetical protein F7018_07620 [Tenacibaculum aiptasiae]|uniref:Uncharacterized protein n=1 Tax=Tenacibaculum aiptasiae TaxID=426481 RepID=A0A7J5AN99_9FLAO|nr:hypothetical protein [Tenacibaculum aiptasiae]KAB1158965.1 hypothetical protein F7018_07620 [Tenacibaculum aiptasiae]
MELTNKQIQRINNYLDIKEIKLIDFRIEIFDHIISEIEQKLFNENLDFETAFNLVIKKWNLELKKTNSFVFGRFYTAPKIVIDRAKRIFLKYFLASFSPIFFSFLIIFNKKIFLSNVFGYFTFFSIVILLFISLFFVIKIITSKEKTVYSFIIKTQVTNFIVMPYILISNSINDIFNISILIYMMVVNYYSISFYKKHKQEKEKYKLMMG